jgi:DNA-binding MarR family transcriptional regulator
MARPDGKLFELLADDVCRDLLRTLLNDEPLTQRQLVAALGVNSSTVSRRMGELEDWGLVTRRSSHAPYDILDRSDIRSLLGTAARLTRVVKERQADEAREHERQLLREAFDGGHERDRAKEA